MKKKSLLLIPILFGMLLTGCGGGGESTPTSNPTQTKGEIVYYTVHFANTTMNDTRIESGKKLNKPADPSKANAVFIGWYKDEALTQEVVFPFTINENTTIYAGFYSYQDAFKKARNNTIGDDIAGYEYDYTLEVSATYMSLLLKGNTTGNAKYNASATDISFYDEHTNSGALFNDGAKYSFKKGRELHEVSLDENEVVKKYVIKEVGDSYRFDSSSFAKAVFEYDDTKLKEITPTSNPNEYKLKTTFNYSSGISLIGNYVNHPLVEKLIGELPETSINTGMYVTFSNDKLNTYRYVMNIDVSGISFDLSYSLTFKNVGIAPTIAPKVFNNTYVSKDGVANAKAEIVGYLNDYKALENSSYDFVVKTAVDYAKKNAINATVNGWTKRKVIDGEAYYLNFYEVDTDHKNADLYKDKGLKDAKGARVKLSTGEIHDLKDKLLGGYSDIGIVDEEEIDNYYLLDVLDMINNVSFIQKITNTSKNEVEYAIGADTSSAVNVLKTFNNSLRLNPLKECSVDVKAFGSFADNSVTVKNFKFKITVTNDKLSNISLSMNGKLAASFPESRDFEVAQDAGYKLEYTLKVTDKGSSYEPAEKVDKVK